MEKQVLKIFIEDALFEIDLKERSISAADNPNFKVWFKDLEVIDGDYRLGYDWKMQRLCPFSTDLPKEHFHLIHLPESLLQPTQESITAFNELSVRHCTGVLVADEDIEARLRGELPKIDIAGSLFYVDWRLRELRSVEDPTTRLNLRDMEMNNEGDKYLCLYHTEYKAIYIPTQYTKQIPEKVVVLEIPYELKLDPIGVARQFELPDTAMLKDFPIEKNLKATVKPISKTEAQQMLDNIRRQYQNRNERQQQNCSKRKGKRL